MQSQDEKGNIVSSVPFDPAQAAELIRAAELQGAVKHLIAAMPDKRDILEINGLMYEVQFTDYKRGEFRARVLKEYKFSGDNAIIKVNPKKRG